MDVEELVKKYRPRGNIMQRTTEEMLRAALTELAAEYEAVAQVTKMNSDRLLRKANERIRQIEAQRVPDGWIPVSERLPDSGVSFLAVTDCAGDVHISTMRLPVLIAKNEKQSGEFIRERVTHWMPLPAAPQPKKEGE